MIPRSESPENITTAPNIRGSCGLQMFKQSGKYIKQSFYLILMITKHVNVSQFLQHIIISHTYSCVQGKLHFFFSVSPLLLHYYHTHNTSHPRLWGGFPTTSSSLWHQLHVLELNSVLTLPTWH